MRHLAFCCTLAACRHGDTFQFDEFNAGYLVLRLFDYVNDQARDQYSTAQHLLDTTATVSDFVQLLPNTELRHLLQTIVRSFSHDEHRFAEDTGTALLNYATYLECQTQYPLALNVLQTAMEALALIPNTPMALLMTMRSRMIALERNIGPPPTG